MKTRVIVVLGAAGLALVVAAVGLTLGAHWDLAQWQYPGSVPTVVDGAKLATLVEGGLGREDVYVTQAGLIRVTEWYQARLEADPDSELRIVPVADCVWLLDTRRLLWISRTFAVLLCAAPDGTHIAVNDLVMLDR